MDIERLKRALIAADAAGDVAAATKLANAIRQHMPQKQDLKSQNPAEYDPESPEFKAKYGPTAGMSGFNKFRAGFGKAAVDLARGAGQLVGVVDRDDVQAARERDAPLMDTGAGKAGFVGGMVANTVPAAFIPGANTVAGSAAIGGGLGLLQPSTSTKETLQNVAFGGGAGAGGLLAGRGIAAGYRGGKALVEPFTKGGQERIAARTLQAFAGGRDKALQAADEISKPRQILPGVKPTSAELANNPGIAQLERTMRNNPEYMTAITDRLTANKGHMLTTLDDIAGDSVSMAGAKELRKAATEPLYEAAKTVTVKSDPALAKLLSRPSLKKAWARANQLAAESDDVLKIGKDLPEQVIDSPILSASGKPIASTTVPAQHAQYSGKALHYLKMSMDDLADSPQVHGIGAQEARLIGDTRKSLMGWIEKNIPEYRTARETYSSMSKPINQMEIGTTLRNKFQPALADFGANSRTRAQAYAQALRDGDATAARTLGRSRASIDDIMAPEQTKRLKEIAEQLGRRANADELGRSVGSPTAQNMISQNVMRQFLGPLGLPESTIARAAESTLLQSALRPAQFVGQIGEERAMAALAKAALDPDLAKEWLRVGVDPQKVGLLIRNQHFIAPALSSGTNAARQ